MKNLSLNQKVIFISLIVTLIISSIQGILLYNSQVKPVPERIETQLIHNMQVFIDSKIDLKIQGGIIGATMLTLDPQTKLAVTEDDASYTDALFKSMKDDYANKTNFKGIFSELINADGQSLSRSWKVGSKGPSRLNDPLIKQVFDNKQAAGSLGFGERGVAVTSVSPIMDGKSFLGVVTMVQGVGSISRDYSNEYKAQNGAWIMLVDKDYVQKKFGDTKAVDSLKPITNRYVIANNKWFAEEVINLTKEVYLPVDGVKSEAYLNQGRFVVDLPAYDEQGKVFGRQIFIQNEEVFSQSLDTAISQAWSTLAESILGIIILTLILVMVIGRLVIHPLAQLKNTITQIENSGDFSLRSQIDQNDEVGQTAQAINSHLDKVNQAINEANRVVGELAKGNLNARMQQDYKGSLLELKSGVNQSSQNVADMLNHISQIMQQLKNGAFHVEVKHQAKGAFAEILDSTSDAMQSLDSAIQDINSVMGQLAAGEFKTRINRNLQGDLQTLTKGINQTVTKLDDVISDITNVMHAQSQGDLTQRVNVQCQGELHVLKESINQSAQNLSNIINDIMIASNTVATAADEVSRGSMSLSDSVQQQAASMEQTSAAMKEMNSAINRNADNTLHVDKLEHQLQENSQTAAKVMQDTINAMNEIQSSSQKIGEIVTMIDSIAFQTNLLALNAAVEAARAGEQGRGFAVVAGEVRALAGKSADAAKEINLLITESVESINKGTELASKSEEVLQKMNASIVQVTDMISDIASTSTSQARGVAEVNKALDLIDNVTQNNAALVEETSAAAESMSDQAAQLKNAVRFFKAESGATRAPLALPKK